MNPIDGPKGTKQEKEISLIECPACKAKVSEEASACPHCGHPIALNDSEKTTFAEFISRDMDSHDSQTHTWRTRLAYIIWIGPFLLLASFIVAKRDIQTDWPDFISSKVNLALLGVLAVIYLLLILIGFITDNAFVQRNDTLREKVWRLFGESLDNNLSPKPRKMAALYFIAFISILIAFVIVFFWLTTYTSPPAQESGETKPTEQVATKTPTLLPPTPTFSPTSTDAHP